MKKNWFTKIIDWLIKLFKGAKKKFVIKSKCKDNCCCGKSDCDCIVAYNEKSDSDDSEVDISVNNNNEVVIS